MSNTIWKIMDAGNRCLYSDEQTFYISFQPNHYNPFGDADTMDGETAIVDGTDGISDRYFILNGDFRSEYEALVPEGIEACIRFYKSHPDKWSSYSNDLPKKYKDLEVLTAGEQL